MKDPIQVNYINEIENSERELQEKLNELKNRKKLAADPSWLEGYNAGYAAATAENKSEEKPKEKKQSSEKKQLFDLTTGTGNDIEPLKDKLDLAITFIQKSKDPVSKSSMLDGIGFDKQTYRINESKYKIFKDALISNKNVKIVGEGPKSKFEYVNKK